MKFSDIEYHRPDLHQVEATLRTTIAKFASAESVDEQIDCIHAYNEQRDEYHAMSSVCYIRHTIDTNDTFYKDEQRFFNDTSPIMEGIDTDYYAALSASRFRSQLEAHFGQHLFQLAELSVRTFAPVIIDDLKRDNDLSTAYDSLVASAQIPFDGEVLTLSQLGPHLHHPDRQKRQAAYEARYGFFANHEQEFDSLYDQLVHTRTAMAQKLGHQTFTNLGYQRLSRTDYGPDEVAVFRSQIVEHIVPLAKRIKERQRQRIGVDVLRYYDEGFSFASGNPTPKGNPEWILDKGRQMYRELSSETDEFFQFMMENELLDVLSRKGKRVGGYCSTIEKFKIPFIFSNFNGTAHDVTVLTHEAGHAFMDYLARDVMVPEYWTPTLEACEIHSMSMEYFTWPWMNLFFEDDTEKFHFSHLSDDVATLPYLVAVDEFQHEVYNNPDMTPQERKTTWRNIERKYLPHRDYEENAYLEQGNYWHQQRHIFSRPFYYIDYALAQICALQFWTRMRENRDSAWAAYLHLCKLGGTMSFVDLVREAGLVSPFEPSCVKGIVKDIEAYLDSVDDRHL